MVGFGQASHERAVARCIQGADGKDFGRKCFDARGCRTKLVEEHQGRHNILAITFVNKDMSESVGVSLSCCALCATFSAFHMRMHHRILISIQEHVFAFESKDAREAFQECIVSAV